MLPAGGLVPDPLTHEAAFVPAPLGHELGKLPLQRVASHDEHEVTETNPTTDGEQALPEQHVHRQHGPLAQAAGVVVGAVHCPEHEYIASNRGVALVVVYTSINN